MTATNVSGALGPAARLARTKTATAPRISVASTHGSETASAKKPMNGGPIRKPNEPIEETAAMRPGSDVRLPAGGAEHGRHAVGDAEPDQEHAHQRDRRLADQRERGGAGRR